MKISIITVFPEIYESFLSLSLVKKAVDNGLVKFNFVQFSDFSGLGKPIDEQTCGPGAGMIIKPKVVQAAIEYCEKEFGYGFKIFFTPQGQRLDQRILKVLADKFCTKNFDSNLTKKCDDKNNHIILICFRYEGIDQRVEQKYADLKLSIGDYVLMGGDLPAQVFIESFLRLLPGVVGRQESVKAESFEKAFLDYPEYGQPVQWKKRVVPEIVLSGNHAAIEKWRKEKACKKTLLNRFDWLRASDLNDDEKQLCKKLIPNHYVALMHTQVIVMGKPGNTSVKTLDIHDISRCCSTYGVKNFFIVSKLLDQRKILDKFLEFWRSDEGEEHNPTRFEALKGVIASSSLQEVVDNISKKEGKKPLIVTTSAKKHEKILQIDYYSQGLLWSHDRPIIFIFGTGQGLCPEIIEKSDYLLAPVNGLTSYNHLSVRSAVSTILDRFLGLNQEKTYLSLLKERIQS